MLAVLVKFGVRSGKTANLGMEVDGLTFHPETPRFPDDARQPNGNADNGLRAARPRPLQLRALPSFSLSTLALGLALVPA